MSAIAMVSRFIIIEPKYSKSEPAIFISVGVLRRQLLQQRLRLLQIARIEACGDPAVNRGEQFARFHRLTPVTPEPRHAHCRAQLETPCFLRLRATFLLKRDPRRDGGSPNWA